MAIEKDFTDTSGVVHLKAYHRVAGIMINRDNDTVQIGMAAYPNKVASDAKKQPLQGSTFGVVLDGDEWAMIHGADEVAKSYNFVKAQKPKMVVDSEGKETSEIAQGSIDLRGGKDV